MLKRITTIACSLLCTSPLFSQGFTEISAAAGIQHMHRSHVEMGGGAAWFDLERDGDEDLIMTGGQNNVALYRNDGNGQFTDITLAAGLGFISSVYTMGVCTGDIDNDGYRELFFTSFMNNPNVLAYNNGDGTFTDISQSSGVGNDSIFSSSAMFFDINDDRLLDLYVGNYLHHPSVIQDSNGTVIGFNPVCQPDQMYLNNGNLTFTDISNVIGLADSGCALAVTLTHQRYFSDKAVLVANDFGAWNIPNQFFTDQGPYPTPYSNESQASGMDVGMYGMGIAQGDFDHDQDIDFYITNIGPNKLMYNVGLGRTFRDTAAYTGVQSGTLMGLNTTGWGTAFLDYDNDTWEDLYTCNGQINVVPMIANVARDPDKLYRNLGNGSFADVTMANGIVDSGQGRGMIRGDFDLDGDDDVLTMVIGSDTNSTEHSKLWRNDLNNGNHWLNLRLEGTTYANRDAYGAMVLVNVGPEHYLMELSGGGSHMSQNSSTIHIGLGTATQYELFVIWPHGDFQPLYLQNLIDTTITVLEDTSVFVVRTTPAADPPSFAVYPNPTSGEWRLQIQHAITEDITLEIWDMQGRRLRQELLPAVAAGLQSFSFDGNSLPTSGAYIVRLVTEAGQSNRFLMRQ